jgi:hypothetical protein
VTKNQPFLTRFPAQICGSIRRRPQDVLAAKRLDLTDSSIATYAMQFSQVVPADFLHGLSVSKRISEYCNVVVFCALPAQILEACRLAFQGGKPCPGLGDDADLPFTKSDTGAYGRGRGRLSLDFLSAYRALCTYELRSTLHERQVHTPIHPHTPSSGKVSRIGAQGRE